MTPNLCTPSLGLAEHDCVCMISSHLAASVSLFSIPASFGSGSLSSCWRGGDDPDASRHPTRRVTFEPFYNPKNNFGEHASCTAASQCSHKKSENSHHLWLTSWVHSRTEMTSMMIIWCNNSHHRTKQKSPRRVDPARTHGCKHTLQGVSGVERDGHTALVPLPTLILVALLQRPVSWWCHMWRRCVGRARRWIRSRNSCCSPILCWRVSLKFMFTSWKTERVQQAFPEYG